MLNTGKSSQREMSSSGCIVRSEAAEMYSKAEEFCVCTQIQSSTMVVM